MLGLWLSKALEDALGLTGGGTGSQGGSWAEVITAPTGILGVELVDLIGIYRRQTWVHIELVHLEVGVRSRLLALLVVQGIVGHIEQLDILVASGRWS